MTCWCAACSLHYRIFLKGVTPYALVRDVSWYTTEGGAPRLIMIKKYGLRNGPYPPGGLGVPADGSLFVLTTYALSSLEYTLISDDKTASAHLII